VNAEAGMFYVAPLFVPGDRPERFEKAGGPSSELGFGGKLCIHLRQRRRFFAEWPPETGRLPGRNA
jgi:hypothetical protein